MSDINLMKIFALLLVLVGASFAAGSFVNCQYDPAGLNYAGKVSHTTSGRTCKKWSDADKHQDLGDHNYCRNVNQASFAPWCYTTDPNQRWEYCPIGDMHPDCIPDPPNGGEGECYSEVKGTDYRGAVSMTRNNRTCQVWTTNTPHSHSMKPWILLNRGLGNHNYCRNPTAGLDADFPWCFTTDPNVTWEFCNIGQRQESC